MVSAVFAGMKEEELNAEFAGFHEELMAARTGHSSGPARRPWEAWRELRTRLEADLDAVRRGCCGEARFREHA